MILKGIEKKNAFFLLVALFGPPLFVHNGMTFVRWFYTEFLFFFVISQIVEIFGYRIFKILLLKCVFIYLCLCPLAIVLAFIVAKSSEEGFFSCQPKHVFSSLLAQQTRCTYMQ